MTTVAGEKFGTLANGSPVHLYRVRGTAFDATFCDYGARLVSLQLADGADVVLGYGNIALYEQDKTYSGAVVGRFGNRIRGGRFSVDGKGFQVAPNNGENALHGGFDGFDRRVWKASVVEAGVEFSLVSPDGDMGFPGELAVTVRYRVEADALRIEYTATTDRATVVNVTNHAYFNLGGEEQETILNHEIMLPTEHYTPVDAGLIPTGELASVEGTPFDFRTAMRIGERIDAEDVQLKRAGGYDHNWAMGEPGVMKLAARLRDPASGRTMTVETTEPGIQFYSGNFIDGTMPNRIGGKYMRRAGLCLETQHYPDSPNQPGFPSTVLRPGETLRSETVLRFKAAAK